MSVEELVLGEREAPSAAAVLIDRLSLPLQEICSLVSVYRRDASVRSAIIEDAASKEQTPIHPDPNDTYSVHEAAPEYAPDSEADTPGAPDGSRSVYESALDYSPPDHEYIMVTGMTAAGMPIEIGQGEGMVTLDKSLLCGDAQEHYAVQVRGTSMTGAGIQDGDYCLIYSASVPLNGQIMLARHGDRLTLKLIREDPQSLRGRRYHLHYVDGSGREALADEDGEDWYIVGKFVCTFVPLS